MLILGLVLDIQAFEGAFDALLRRVVGREGLGTATKRINLAADDCALAAGAHNSLGDLANILWMEYTSVRQAFDPDYQDRCHAKSAD